MKNLLAKFLKDESGASLIEYILLAALIGVAAVAGMKLVGSSADSTLSTIAGSLK